jgi:hypothetical protein
VCADGFYLYAIYKFARNVSVDDEDKWVDIKPTTEDDGRDLARVKEASVIAPGTKTVKDYVFLTRCHELTFSICVSLSSFVINQQLSILSGAFG